MKLNLERYLKKMTIDDMGELIRSCVFVESEGTGCYQDFELYPEFEHIRPEELSLAHLTLLLGCFAKDPDYIPEVKAFMNEDWIVAWHWDGDGVLLFAENKEGGNVFVNGDCKKTYGWDLNPNWINDLPENYYDIDPEYDSRG